MFGQTRHAAESVAPVRTSSTTQIKFSDARVGIASAAMLKRIGAEHASAYIGRVVWILSTNPINTVHGIAAGMTIAQAATHLKLTKSFTVGSNTWYLVPDGTVTAMLKTHDGTVVEVGIAIRSLSDGSRHRRYGFLEGF